MKKQLTFFALAILIASSASALPEHTVEEKEQIPAGETSEYANITLENNDETQYTVDEITIQTIDLALWEFDTEPSELTIEENTTEQIMLQTTVPENYPPETSEAIVNINYENEENHEIEINPTVEANQEWNITEKDFQQNATIGSSGTLGEIEFENTGNEEATITTEVEGEIQNYIGIPSQFQVFPSIDLSQSITYQIPSETEFGSYNGSITFESANNQSETINISTEFLDQIPPVIQQTDVPDIEATQQENITVEATDNLEVESVEAEVYHQIDNENQTVNETIENIEFNSVANSDEWYSPMEDTDRTGKFYINITAIDSSGNTDQVTEDFIIRPLDSLKTSENIDLTNYKFGNEFENRLATLETDTPVEITLSRFSESLGQWGEIGVKEEDTDETPDLFSETGDTVEIGEAQNISLYVFSDQVGRFNGELEFETIEHHREVNDTQFSGEYLNFTAPQDTEFEMYGIPYECDGFTSEKASDSYYDCDFRVYADQIAPEASLEEDMQIALPSEAQRQAEQIWQSRIEDVEWDSQKNYWLRNIFLLFAVGSLGFSIFYMRYYPTHYSVHLKSTEKSTKGIKEKLLGE